MSKDRQDPCKFYICEHHQCEKGRVGEHKNYCQKCNLYQPRARVKHVNIKKQKLQKIRETEME